MTTTETKMDITLNPVSDPNKNDLDIDLNAQWNKGNKGYLTLRNVGDNLIFFKIKGNVEAVRATVIKPVKAVLRPKSKERVLFKLNTAAKRNLKQGDNTFMFLVKFNSMDLDQFNGGFKNLKYNARFRMVVRNDFAYKSPALRNVKDQVNAIMIKFEQGVSFVEKFQDDFDVDDSIPVTSMHVVKFIM